MLMQTDEVDILNKKISGEYVSIDGHVLFKLIWSESAFENRYGTFREFTEAGLFVREVTEVRRVRKYNYIHNRWIFEAWAPGNLTANRETPDAASGDYVPVYVFEDRGGNYLPPNEKVVRFLIAAFYGRVKKDEVPSQEYLDEQEIQRSVATMDDHPAWFQTRPGPARNAIWYAGGVTKWHQRRATFDPENLFNEQSLRAIEEEAKAKNREREKALREQELILRQTQEIERQREYEREVRAEAAKNRAIEQELAREQEQVAEIAPPPLVIQTRSPNH